MNHYSKGVVIPFLNRYTAGIRPRDVGPFGDRRFHLRPRSGGGLKSAGAAFDSPYDRIGSEWRTEDGTVVGLGPGEHRHTCPAT
ncbi:hypothetical protein GTW46_26355 [Streptomyces sp. SID6013]|nr:hypothetical protein [Streptomyces sp. SID6013]